MIFKIKVLLNLILCSFFLFPIGFSFLPSGLNTKLMMAAVGLLCLYGDLRRTADIEKNIFWVVFGGCIFSCIGLFSVFYNETNDYAYAGYVVSMLVWLSSAYVFISGVGHVHKQISFRLIVDYLLIVCLLQCFMALLIELFLPLKYWVDSTIRLVAIDIAVLNEIDRLYGIGAALDPAGVRFASVLILISVVLKKEQELSHKRLTAYILSFLLIAGIGNLISRTTMVGAGLGISYLLWSPLLSPDSKGRNRQYRIYGLLFCAGLLVFIVGYLVFTNFQEMRELIRYGFEAFFNFAENGEFTTGSTEKLNTMWVYPDNIKTWIIGDGWFYDPLDRGFYMFTDIGYLRFIFYCGLSGLLLFICFFIYIVHVLTDLFPEYRMGFYLLLILGFLVWIKVSTDLFQFYAIFLSLSLYLSESKIIKSR